MTTTTTTAAAFAARPKSKAKAKSKEKEKDKEKTKAKAKNASKRNVTFGSVMSVAKFHKSSTAVPVKSHRVRPVPESAVVAWPARSLSPRSWLLQEKILVADMAALLKKLPDVHAYRRKLLSFKAFTKLIKSVACIVSPKHYKRCVQRLDAYFAARGPR